jgi:hypothetical protein
MGMAQSCGVVRSSVRMMGEGVCCMLRSAACSSCLLHRKIIQFVCEYDASDCVKRARVQIDNESCSMYQHRPE